MLHAVLALAAESFVLQGNMRRVENEKQQAQRLASYAHLEEQERKEPWLQLQMGLQVSSVPVCAAREASAAHAWHVQLVGA